MMTAAARIDRATLETHRPQLVKFALLQLRNPTHAEDAVQETFAAALAAADRFSGGSTVRTWLIGILKHKIIDHLRRASREQPLEPFDGESGADDFDALFDERGHFAERPAEWGDPERTLGERRFFEALERCLAGLPPKTAQAFVMREMHGADTDEICAALGITRSNCWVMLYRARMLLRECLQERWFGAGNGAAA